MEGVSMKKIILVLMIICFSTIIFASSGEISVERSIDGKVLPGDEINIEMIITFNVGEPSSVIITEEIPSGWEMVESTPKANDFEGKKKWLIYGNKLKDEMSVKYTLKAPVSFNASQELNGTWKTVSSAGFVEGESLILEAAESTPPPQESMDYTLLLIGVIVVIVIVAIVVVVKKKK